MSELAIIVVNYNTEALTLKCLKSIYDSKPKIKFEIWVIDNNSSDNSALIIKKHFPQINFIESDKNIGFSGGNNLALRQVNAKYYLLLNSDTEITKSALDNLYEFAETSDFGICSCKLINKNGSFQPNGGNLPTFSPLFFWLSGLDDFFGKFIKIKSYQSRNIYNYINNKGIDWVSGSVMLIKYEVIKRIGLLDDKIFMYGEDVEYCWRANNAGYKIGWTDSAEIIHLGGGSSKSPKYNQWIGEFRGLIYIYNKFFDSFMALSIRILFYIFILARIIGFGILSKISYSRTYAKIFINL